MRVGRRRAAGRAWRRMVVGESADALERMVQQAQGYSRCVRCEV